MPRRNIPLNGLSAQLSRGNSAKCARNALFRPLFRGEDGRGGLRPARPGNARAGRGLCRGSHGFGEDLRVQGVEVAAEDVQVLAERGEFGRQPRDQAGIDGGIHARNAPDLRVLPHE
ncbi:hypothetical protein ACQP06_34445 [Nocardia sp. CA-136227]|uniref:hypothetical protein n=1 Tax=Nocardia sp. CA-136227 TaxID=3239979 RepID=UPI003D96A36E